MVSGKDLNDIREGSKVLSTPLEMGYKSIVETLWLLHACNKG